MTATGSPPRADVDAIRADGGLVRIRELAETDRAAIDGLDERVSARSIYLRFFSASRATARSYLDRLTRAPDPSHAALVALIDERIVAVAGYERLGDDLAEIAILVDDACHHQGIGTLLVEHLAALGRRNGVRQFVAEILQENVGMIDVIRKAGFTCRTEYDYDVVRITFGLDVEPAVLAAIDHREQLADIRSLRPLLAPRSVVVIGASPAPGSVGHEVLRSILAGGFTGEVYAVNPRHAEVLGVPCAAAVSDLPAAPELAIVAVPAAVVGDVVETCGRAGVRGLIVLSSGFGETGPVGTARQADLVRTARRHGMRVIGPNCLGVINTAAGVRLSATFAPIPMRAGGFALASQSGALGIAVLTDAARCGLGTAQFVSVGNKSDVSGNDLLMAWEHDENVSVIGLYLESFGNPRKFARIARRVSRSKPIVAIKAGRTAAGRRAGESHTAAAAASDEVVDALFDQSGVVRVDTMVELVDAARILAAGPALAGPRVAIVGNSGGPQILAADAAAGAGLTIVTLRSQTQSAIAAATPGAAAVANPVDLGAGASAEAVAQTLRVVLADEEVDAVLAVFTETFVAGSEVMQAIVRDLAETSPKPIVFVQVGGSRSAIALSDPTRSVAVFAFPEPAARALGLAYRCAQIRSGGEEPSAPPADVDRAGAAAIVASATGWLGPAEVAGVLRCYGIPVAEQRVLAAGESAAQAARELGFPVAVKTTAGGVHKTDVGGVKLDIRTEAELDGAVRALRDLGDGALLVQSMARPGTELIVGAVQDQQFGPLVMVGIGGVLADVIGDRQFRLAPVSESEAHAMLDGLRAQRILDGFRGQPPVPRALVTDLIRRVGALVDDLPEIAELDLNPVVCHGESVLVVDARIRVAPAVERDDPGVRRLRAV